MDCSYAGITGDLESLDLSGLPTPATKLTIRGPYGLSYRYNTFTSLGESFVTGGEASLVTLVVSGNSIVTVDPDALRSVPNLQHLDLSDNPDLLTLPPGTISAVLPALYDCTIHPTLIYAQVCFSASRFSPHCTTLCGRIRDLFVCLSVCVYCVCVRSGV